MMNPFKIGDKVTLIDAVGIHTLELFNSYKIIEINGIKIAFEENIDENDNLYFYNSRRFTKDIKFLRRKKLQKLLNETS